MATSTAVPSLPADPAGREAKGAGPASSRAAVGYVAGAALVAAAAVVAFVVDHLVAAPNLSLVFVLPVIISAVAFGWGPSLVSALLSVAVFDFFFLEPRYTFQVASPTDLWALGLLLVVAAIASTVATESRRRALAAGRAAEQAEALHALAHAVIRGEPSPAVVRTAAESLGRIFDAPAVVLEDHAGRLVPVAQDGEAKLSAQDLQAAEWSLANGKATRAEAYPFDQAVYDFWPVSTPANRRLVLGVKLTGAAGGRPGAADRLVELVAGYLAAAAGETKPRRRAT